MNKKAGETAECYFDYLALCEGMVVSEPRGDSAPYDRIVEYNGKLTKVQIKMRSSTNSVTQKSYIVGVHKSDKTPYTAKEVDIVAIHLRNENIWYFVPIKHINKKMRINPKKDKLDRFKNNWNVFK
jgi:uncharacterized protein YneR